MEKKKGRGAGGVAIGGVAALAVVAALLGSGRLGLGSGLGFGNPADTSEKEDAVVEVVDQQTTTEVEEPQTEAVEAQAEGVEIRIQGREFNYQNVTYGNAEHPLDELLEKLQALPKDTRIDLIVEDTATKNAVDELESSLQAAGFQDIRK